MTNATFSQATGLLHQHGCGVGHFSVSFTIVQEQSHYLTVLNEPHVLVRKQSRIDASKRHRQFPSFNTPLSQTGSVTSKRCMSVISVYVSGRRLACVTVCSQKAAVRCCCWKTFVSRHSYSWTVSAIWQCLQTTHFSETAEPKRWIETTPFAYQPTALPLNQTSSQVNAVSHFCLRTRKTSYMCYSV